MKIKKKTLQKIERELERARYSISMYNTDAWFVGAFQELYWVLDLIR